MFPGGGVFVPGGEAGCLRLLGDFHRALGRASICDMVGAAAAGSRAYLYTFIAFKIEFKIHQCQRDLRLSWPEICYVHTRRSVLNTNEMGHRVVWHLSTKLHGITSENNVSYSGCCDTSCSY